MDFEELNAYLTENNLVVISYEEYQILHESVKELSKYKSLHRRLTFWQRVKYAVTGVIE